MEQFYDFGGLNKYEFDVTRNDEPTCHLNATGHS